MPRQQIVNGVVGGTPETPQQTAVRLVQRYIDSVAQSWGYDNIFTACTYADEAEDRAFQAEGRALRKWRSQVWRACWNLASSVGSAQELLAALPVPPIRPN